MSLQENTTNLRKILNAVKKLPSAGGVELPTLFAPTIAFDNGTTVLTVTDTNNGSFAVNYDLYANNEFVATLPSKTATLSDYIEQTETIELKVQASAEYFNSSDSNVVKWYKFDPTEGSAGLAYTTHTTFARCTGIGTATDVAITIASEYEGLPVTEISSYSFSNNYQITSVTIPMPVHTIGNSAFSYAGKLKTVRIPPSVTNISHYAFEGSYSRNVYITDIEAWCNISFGNYASCPINYGYLNLNGVSAKEIVLPNRVKAISDYAFYGCENLKRIDFSSHTSIPTIGSQTFYRNNSTLQFKVPANLIDEWKNATNWSTLANKIVTEFTNEL